MGKPTTESLLKKILSDNLEAVYVDITNKATEWAVAGFINEANNLLEQLWSFNIPHLKDVWLQDEGFQVMWKMSNKRPVKIPFQLKEISEIENENWSRNICPVWHKSYTEKFINKPIRELHGHELFVKAITAAFEQSEDVKVILAALKYFVETSDLAGYTSGHATTCGALLAARNNQDEFAEYFIKVWGEGYFKYWMNYSLAYLMRDRYTARYLLKGLLTNIFNLSSDLCKSETEEIIAALSRRVSKGQMLGHGNLSWLELLDRIAGLAIEQKTMDFTEEILQKKTLRRPPATKEDISAAEQQLNVILPDDYKAFLLTSNGFECFLSTGVTLASIDKVDFLINVDEQLVDIWASSMDDVNPDFSNKFKSSIIIGGQQEEQQLLLIPLNEGKWECWYFANWAAGETVYPSFRFYMEHQLQRLEDGLWVD